MRVLDRNYKAPRVHANHAKTMDCRWVMVIPGKTGVVLCRDCSCHREAQRVPVDLARDGAERAEEISRDPNGRRLLHELDVEVGGA